MNRGCKLNQDTMKSATTLEQGLKTRWNNFDDIKKYGWSLSKEENKIKINKDEKTSAEPVLRALGIPGLDDPSWKKVPWIHNPATTVDGKRYPVGTHTTQGGVLRY